MHSSIINFENKPDLNYFEILPTEMATLIFKEVFKEERNRVAISLVSKFFYKQVKIHDVNYAKEFEILEKTSDIDSGYSELKKMLFFFQLIPNSNNPSKPQCTYTLKKALNEFSNSKDQNTRQVFIKKFKALIQLGAPYEHKDAYGSDFVMNVFQKAIQDWHSSIDKFNDYRELVVFLLNEGVDVNKFRSPAPLLSHIIHESDVDESRESHAASGWLVKTLLEYGADPLKEYSEQDNRGFKGSAKLLAKQKSSYLFNLINELLAKKK